MSRSKGRGRGRVPGGAKAPLTLGSLTHVGMVRSANQDAYCAILAPNAPPGTDALLSVADGMGGHQAGEVASTMAIQGLVRHLSSSQGAGGVTPISEWHHAKLLEEVIQQINAEVNQAATRPETRGMGTTLTVALLAGSSLAIGHVGDSRLYLLRNGQLRQLSHDHSWVAEEVARGAISPEEARSHPRRNILTRAIGTGPQVQVDTGLTQVEEGDTILLCSDGLHGLVTDEEIARTMASQPPQEACQFLVDRANALGGNDNITVIVARVAQLRQVEPPPKRGKAADEAKTIGAPGRAKAPTVGKRRRSLLRIILLPIKLLGQGLWALAKLLGRGLRALGKLLGRGLWALAKLPFKRRR